MGIAYLNAHLAIITSTLDASKSSNSVYICAHGGSTSGKTFVSTRDVIFYCPDKHELNASATAFFSDSMSRVGAQPFRYPNNQPVPDYHLAKAVGQSRTTGFDYTQLEAWRTSNNLRSDVVSIRDPAFHSSTVKLSWVIQQLQSNSYDYSEFHVFCCRCKSSKAPAWDLANRRCLAANCQLPHDV